MSKDTVEAQAKFAKKNSLTFRLLADAKGEVIELYGVGGLFGYSKRQSFLIDSKGKVAKVYEKVSPARHAAEVKEALETVG